MTNTIDKQEIEQFSSLSNQWWDKSGSFSALHKMSNARIEFIIRNSKRIISKNYSDFNTLNGLKCLDIGCGGGILSEPMSRLGALVTGIDASEMAIQSAIAHSKKSRLDIDFKCMSTGDLIKSNKLSLNDGVVASFSRALAEDLHYDLTDTEFNDTISNNINMIKAASE